MAARGLRGKLELVLAVPAGAKIDRTRPSGPGRRSLIVEGASVCTLPDEVVESLGVRGGLRWTPELGVRVARAVEEDQANLVAQRLLAVRLRSKGELLSRLRRAGVREAKAVRLVEQLEAAGKVNDAVFARAYARSIVNRKPAGAMLVERKLRERRVDGPLSKQAAREALSGKDIHALAMELARKKLRVMPQSLDTAAKTRRLLGLLARRGFDGGVASAVVRGLIKNAPADDE